MLPIIADTFALLQFICFTSLEPHNSGYIQDWLLVRLLFCQEEKMGWQNQETKGRQ